jgi:nitrogen fixation protein FixH
MTTAMARPREFTGKHMLAVMVAFFGVIIGVNVTLAVLANRTWSGLIVANGYVASQQFNLSEERARAQALLGWQAELAHDGQTFTVTMRTKDGAAIPNLKLEGMLRRPVTAKEDMVLAFTARGDGSYAAPAALAKGQWEFEMSARDPQGQEFADTYRFVVKGE